HPRTGQALSDGERAAARPAADQAHPARHERTDDHRCAERRRLRGRTRSGRRMPDLSHDRAAEGGGCGGDPGHSHREAAAMSRPRTRNQMSVSASAGNGMSRTSDDRTARAPADIRPCDGSSTLPAPIALGQFPVSTRRNRHLVPRPGAVARILTAVRTRGDAALRSLARRFDGVELTEFEIPRSAWERALAGLDPDVRATLELAAANITAFHRAQLPSPIEIETSPGVRLGRRSEPLRRVGVYAPGGRAAYPSSVLMDVLPARVAGVDEIIVCSPPGPAGQPSPAVLAACALAGADRVFAIAGVLRRLCILRRAPSVRYSVCMCYRGLVLRVRLASSCSHDR